MTIGKVARPIFDFLEVYLPSLIFFLLIISVAIEVFSRYVFNTPIPELFEVSIYTFVWAIYLGAALAKRYNQHIRFDLLYIKLSQKARLWVDILFDALTGIVFLILLVPSIQYTIMNYKIKASVLRIPWTYLLMCFPVFLILILIHNGMAILSNFRELRGQGVPEKEIPPWQ
jgi:TRAP-type C4-dicarboxylate transport system permease small subunit